MWLTRYLSLQDSQSFSFKTNIFKTSLKTKNMVERGERYFKLVRTITLPKKYAPIIPFEAIIYHLPVSITVEDYEDDELTFKPFNAYSD